MNDRLADVEARLTEIECRLGALEKKASLAANRMSTQRLTQEQASESALREDSVFNAATHLGRVLLIFGGAYLLRAITDFGFLPTQAGIPIGTAYALLWLYMAYRSGANDDRRVAAMLYGGVSVLLGFPILVEAVTRFELLSGPASAAALNRESVGWRCWWPFYATCISLRLVGHGGRVGDSVQSSCERPARRSLLGIVLLLIRGGVSGGRLSAAMGRNLQWLGAMGAGISVSSSLPF